MARSSRAAQQQEWPSILIALGTTLGSAASFWLAPTYEPASGILWTVAGWFAFGYLFIQTMFLLVSATKGRVISLVDPVFASLPFSLVLLCSPRGALAACRFRCSN
jgi:hypothetical protein